MSNLSIVIVNYKSWSPLTICLDSLLNQKKITPKIIVLDNNSDDNKFIESLMVPEHEPGKYASWIAAPDQGIDNKSGDFEYVKVHDA